MVRCFVLFVSVFGSLLQAQQSFFVDGRRYGQCLLSGPNVVNTSVRVAYDSVLSNFTYKVLLDVQTDAFAGMARESNDSIFFRDVVTQTDYLYYNFNLMQGDTTFFNGWMVADSVTNVTLLNGQQAKYVVLRGISGGYYHWIYGVGDIANGITQQSPWPDGPALPMFVCVRDSSQLLWVTDYLPLTVYCDTLAGVFQTEAAIENTVLCPNPVTDRLRIQSEGNTIGRVDVIDNYGNVALQYHIIESQVEIDLLILPAGVYYLQTFSRAGELISVQKLIKL